MNHGIPLIRAAALIPVIRYLERGGVAVDRLLQASNLSYFPYDDPERPIASASVMEFATLTARTQGLPDLGCRVIESASIQDLGTLGSIIAAAPNLREALLRASGWLRFFAGHQSLRLVEGRDGCSVVATFVRSLERSRIHIAEQYTAMMVQRICQAYGMSAPVFRKVTFHGEPIDGLGQMQSWFCGEVAQSRDRTMTLLLNRDAFELRSCHAAAIAEPVPPQGWLPLAPGLTFRESTRYLIEAMLFDGVPGIEDVAVTSGLSTRTLQRRLHEEGTSYSDLLEEMRRRQALADVLDRNLSLTSVSTKLGYSSQGSFTRAFRRWTEDSPRGYRRRAAH